MKRVLHHIRAQRRNFEQHSFFGFLRDESRSPAQRLAFLPVIGHFVLSFGDLNRYVLCYPAPVTELEHAVNAHTAEDAQHWPWYLEDLRALGFDNNAPLTDWLSEYWSEEMHSARTLTYTLVQLSAGTSAAERLALIEVMEETGNAVFNALSPLALRVEREYGLELRFCGQHHLQRESGHVLHLDHRTLAEITLDDASYERSIARVDSAFAAFESLLDTMYTSALERSPARPLRGDWAQGNSLAP